MEKEKNSTIGPVFRELVNLGLYKRSQGRIARQVTFGAVVAALAFGAWQLSEYLVDTNAGMRFGLPGLVLLLGLWFAYRVVNVPRFADFLISVEAEMAKVSWPSRSELIRSSIVVLVTIIALAAILAIYDAFWGVLLRMLI